jgi:hypothetical protein
MKPITTIVHFEVPTANIDEALRYWRSDIEPLMKKAPGLIGGVFHRATDPSAPYQFINVARWQSAEALQAALKGVGEEAQKKQAELAATLKRLGVRITQNNYTEEVRYSSSDREAHVLSLMKKGDDAFNRKDITGMNAAHHPDITAHMTGSDKPTHGRAALAAALEGMFRAFPDIHVHNDPYAIQFADGDWMTVLSKVTGTFSGELVLPDGKTIPGTGKAFDVTFSTTGKWEGDLLVEEYVSWDSAVMNQQIGIA